MKSCKICKYGFIGGISTLIHLAVSYTIVYRYSENIYISNIFGFLSAFLFSYIMQSLFTFKHEIKLEKALKFFSVQFGALLLSILLVDIISLKNSYFEIVLVVIVLPLITYLLHQFWTFNKVRV
ncbi:MAG: GtrA family protein [Sulfurimonas sp.]|nr:MAG: GtrA family protein [Sulfurimonas sp.]